MNDWAINVSYNEGWGGSIQRKENTCKTSQRQYFSHTHNYIVVLSNTRCTWYLNSY